LDILNATDCFLRWSSTTSSGFELSMSESKQLERIERLLNYVVYLLVFEAGLTIGLVYLLQQLVSLLSY